MEQRSALENRWVQQLRRNHKTTQSWACIVCDDRKISPSADGFWEHAQLDHQDKSPKDASKFKSFRAHFEAESAEKCLCLSGLRLQGLSIDALREDLKGGRHDNHPRKHPAMGVGISTVSASPLRKSESPPPRRSKLRPTSLPYGSSSEILQEDPQPETRPISQEQLVAEVKRIYAGLVMVEAKCIDVDNKQATLAQADGIQSKPNNKQWQALIALHRTLLHEHHDFFLASQHPSASAVLRRLASNYAMPARMWCHGTHSFLKLLRHRFPASLDHMLAFIYLAYSTMAILYETVPAFEDTWIECLGDLGRYRMAIEDDDIRDREVWTGVARHWYSKASDKSPMTGRLYHHLAILVRPNELQQLFYYAKSLCIAVLFTSARESILTLFEPVLNTNSALWGQLPIMLNISLASHQRPGRIESDAFPLPEKDDRPLPEYFAIRGLLWVDNYFPETWFTNENIDEEEEDHEVASIPTDRKERILWLQHRIASGAKWTASVVLAALQNKTFRSMALLTQISEFFPVTLASVINETNSTATETNPQPESDGSGPSQYFRHVWHQLRDEHSGPIIENATVAAILSSSYFIITHLDDGPKSRTPILPLSRASASRSWLKADLLPIATAFISAGTLYLGNGELESDWQLAMLATHNLCLSIKFIQKKLSKFPKTTKAAEFIMASTSLSSTGLLTKFFSVVDGRYKNPLVQAAMFLPLTNLFLTVFWIRFIRNYGVAKALEEGDLIAAIRAFWQKRSCAIIAVVLILWLLAKV